MQTVCEKPTAEDYVAELNRRGASRELARRHLLDFVLHYAPQEPYFVGQHTRAFCDLLEAAIHRADEGISSYLILLCPPRHGKSDIASRRLPAWYLGGHPDSEVILATYGASLSVEMSRAARRVVASDEYRLTYGLSLSPESRAVSQWQLLGHRGKLHAVGLEGGITGHGADLLVIDDYCKSRAQAESAVVRESVWDVFRSDLMTRLAPVRVVVVVANRWHEDDLVGRIALQQQGDPSFPRFEMHSFPAMDEAGHFLFPERFSDEWYEHERALVGAYAWQAMFMLEPKPRHGNLLAIDRIRLYDEAPKGLAWVRYWDLASTEKQRVSDNPDATAGTKAAVRMQNGVPSLWVDDVILGTWAAPERDRVIDAAAEVDGTAVPIGIETVAGYTDAGQYAQRRLGGRYVVKTGPPKGDKVVRATPLEPVFEAGHVYVRRARWNAAWLAELAAFPMGRKDDQVDSLSGAFEMAQTRARSARVEML